MTNLYSDNITPFSFDPSTALVLAKPGPFTIDLSDLLSAKMPYTPSSLSTYDSISIKAEEDVFRLIPNVETFSVKGFEEVPPVEMPKPRGITLGDFVTKRPYRRRINDPNKPGSTKKEANKRRQKVASTEDMEEMIIKKEKLENGECREFLTPATDQTIFPEIVLKDGKVQLAVPDEIKVKKELEIVQPGKKKVATSASFKNINHTEKWTEKETEKFYRALELFGSDFSMMAKVFKNRNRNQIKNKFLREEKTAFEKVNAALKGSSVKNFQTLLIDFQSLKQKASQHKCLQGKIENDHKSNILLPMQSLNIKQEAGETNNIIGRERSESCCSALSMASIDKEIMEDLAEIFVPKK